MSGSPEVRPRHWAKPGPKPQPFNDDRCGERAGYKRHLQHGIEPCDPCRAANTKHCAKGRNNERGRA